MASSLALALTVAAISACGGGSADASSSVEAPASVGGDAFVTTNASAVAAVSEGPSSAGAASPPASDTGDVPPTIVAADTSSQSGVAQPLGAQGGSSSSQVVPRPAGNTGTGFYVAGGKLYDAKGQEFRIRGVNRNHWDSYGTPAGLPLSGANSERIVLSFANPTSYNMGIVNSQMLANKIVPIPGNWSGTCKSDVASLTAIVDVWVAQAAAWTALNSNGLINIANEWGPPNSIVWRDSYITAIARMRAAGYTGTLVVDSGGCGQDAADIVKYGAAVLASDPQKNILFDVHVYGGFSFPATVSWQQDFTTSMAQLKATGLPIILGEFGPGRRIGPSPTSITPQQVIATAEANGWGWMPWSWDDNNLANCASDDNGFSMTLKCGTFKTTADLTAFGKAIVPILQSTAAKASIFN